MVAISRSAHAPRTAGSSRSNPAGCAGEATPSRRLSVTWWSTPHPSSGLFCVPGTWPSRANLPGEPRPGQNRHRASAPPPGRPGTLPEPALVSGKAGEPGEVPGTPASPLATVKPSPWVRVIGAIGMGRDDPDDGSRGVGETGAPNARFSGFMVRSADPLRNGRARVPGCCRVAGLGWWSPSVTRIDAPRGVPGWHPEPGNVGLGGSGGCSG
jgi:hypothetical protein